MKMRARASERMSVCVCGDGCLFSYVRIDDVCVCARVKQFFYQMKRVHIQSKCGAHHLFSFHTLRFNHVCYKFKNHIDCGKRQQ